MKSLAVLCVLGLAMVVADEEKYTDKYDNTDIQQIMSNKRLMVSYINCVIDKGPCTPDGLQLKVNLKDAIQNLCKKCTEKQKEMAKAVGSHVYREYPDYFVQVKELYDPEGKYMADWKKEIGVA
ncbi:ejaculatory bulb-specific protein 3-like [Aricia agestis]|uniref:ejaculatory bulb-specific protein 3-like n=1 Tax=Aricia agestis TaxID=91739 RepID=UPI001C20172B|nr:ejaculatory bulb-specific protein 3-like [Aricia agestis]